MDKSYPFTSLFKKLIKMEEKQKSPFSAAIVPGIILGLALIVFDLILFLMDVDRESKLRYVGYLIMAGVIFWAMTTYRDKQLGGFISYGKAFGVGFWTGIIGSVIAVIYTYIYFTAIDPGVMDEIILAAEEEALNANPNMSDEQLEQTLSLVETFTSAPVITGFVMFFNAIGAAVLSLLIAIFVKREDNSLA